MTTDSPLVSDVKSVASFYDGTAAGYADMMTAELKKEMYNDRLKRFVDAIIAIPSKNNNEIDGEFHILDAGCGKIFSIIVRLVTN
jgi:hypothetical protein